MRENATPDIPETQVCQIDRYTVMPYVAFGEPDVHEIPVGLIPGLGQTEQHWGNYPDSLGGRVYTFGLPTYENGEPAAFSLGGYASLTLRGIQKVLEQAGYRTPDIHLGGLSWGGFLAQQIALDHPSMIDSMHLMSTWPANMHVPWRGLPKLAAIKALNSSDRNGHDLGKVYGGVFRTDPTGALKQFKWMAERKIDPRQQKAQKHAIAGSIAPLAFRMTLRAARGELPPTLVVVSDDDPIVPLSVANDSARGLGMDVYIVEDGGHVAPITHSAEVAQAVSAFRKQLLGEATVTTAEALVP